RRSLWGASFCIPRQRAGPSREESPPRRWGWSASSYLLLVRQQVRARPGGGHRSEYSTSPAENRRKQPCSFLRFGSRVPCSVSRLYQGSHTGCRLFPESVSCLLFCPFKSIV